ncbi:hypothetical protein BEL07_08415 [Mycolicibacterium grossiae]|uniref:GGDEF domain-containing protein n=1 Tax=Mycolicibacterium grossiae TaxID=1552759 RepID=A0A1E8Q804_9MYCO|nr:diguanylate cyclase [Mycolicibacterium grossiae]OFJ54240.1 hypothetical protein BEL07_08415 [Mycolicibacterium grossiae]
MVNGLDGQPVALEFLNSPDVLRAVLLIAQAALSAGHFHEALEVIAEQSLVAVNAASFSISRWQRDQGVLRTLINVGELGPDEQRWPDNEFYPLAEYPYAAELLRHGRPYVHSIDDADAEPASMRVLDQLGKESQIGVPILYQGSMWGELWATGTHGRRFGAEDVRLLSAIATQASIAIGRAELFSEVSRFAYEDPLTRLANRRRVDEALAEIDDIGAAATLLIGDVDGLKDVNDRFGHPAGDDLLRTVAEALSDAASAFGALLVARLGGDEFCVILPGDTLSDAEGFAVHASRRIADETGTQVSLCWGAAIRESAAPGDARQLMIAADSALLNAKRLGPGRLWSHQTEPHEQTTDRDWRRAWPPARRGVTDNDAITRVVAVLDQLTPRSTAAALEIMATECSRILHAAAWSLWVSTPNRSGMRTISGIDSRVETHCGLRIVAPTHEVVHPVVDFRTAAVTSRNGEAFAAFVDHGYTDAAEAALLHRLGHRAVLAVGVPGRDVDYLVRLYFDSPPGDLGAAAAGLRVLAHHCAHRFCPGLFPHSSPLD